MRRSPSGLNLQEKATVTKFSDNLRRLTPLELQCQLFCGGRRCKYESSAAWSYTQMALNGFYSHWITNSILAMARPNSEQMEKYDLIGQFQSKGIKTIINLQQPGEHGYCGPPLNESGFSYSPTAFMENGIYFYNYCWKDYSVASLDSITDTVKVIAFSLQQGKVAIHCHAGLGRTGVLIACYLVYAYRVSANAAIRFVRWKRPNSIQTRAQVMCIFQFADYILPKFTVFAQKNSDDVSEFTLAEHQRHQSAILHGYESRNLRYLPKVIHVICDRLLNLCHCKPVAILEESKDELSSQSFWVNFLSMQNDSQVLQNRTSVSVTSNKPTTAPVEPHKNENKSESKNPANHMDFTFNENACEDRARNEKKGKGSPSKTKNRQVAGRANELHISNSNVEVDPKANTLLPALRKSTSSDFVVPTSKTETQENSKRPLRPKHATDYQGDRIVFPARIVSCSNVLLFPDDVEENIVSDEMNNNVSDCVQSPSESNGSSNSGNLDMQTRGTSIEEELSQSDFLEECHMPLRKACSATNQSSLKNSKESTIIPLIKSHSYSEVGRCQKPKEECVSRQASEESSTVSLLAVHRISGCIDIHNTVSAGTLDSSISSIGEEDFEVLSQIVLHDENVDLSLLDKLFNRSSSQIFDGISPASSSITIDKIADCLMRSVSETTCSDSKTMEELKEKLNRSHDGWELLRSSSNTTVLIGLLYMWLAHLKEPVITKDQLIRMTVSAEDPITQLHILDKPSRVTVEYLARFVINLDPLSESRKQEIFTRLFLHLCHFISDENQNPGQESDIDLETLTNVATKFAHNLFSAFLMMDDRD